MYGIISPKDWGLEPATAEALDRWREVGVDPADWEERARQATYHWLMRNWREEDGAFASNYSAPERPFAPPQLTNLIAPWQMMAAYDRYGDESLLGYATRATDWLYTNFVETHPMSVVVGGVRDAWREEEVWAKFTAEYLILCLGLYERTDEREYLRRAIQSARSLIQAQLHEHAVKYSHTSQMWVTRGWQSFGRVIEAFLYLHQVTQDNAWLGAALNWGEFGLTLQAPDGGFYLINGEYYNSDVAADELRAFAFLCEHTRLPQFKRAGERFAAWHLRLQRPEGAWLLTIDRFANPVSEYVGPGDVPNIAIALLRLHRAVGNPSYLVSALRAMRYALTQQVTPGSDHPHSDDENVMWGYWSWDPYYDYTMSGDQITHLARGLWSTMDYLATLEPDVSELVIEEFAQDSVTGGTSSP